MFTQRRRETLTGDNKDGVGITDSIAHLEGTHAFRDTQGCRWADGSDIHRALQGNIVSLVGGKMGVEVGYGDPLIGTDFDLDIAAEGADRISDCYGDGMVVRGYGSGSPA